MSRLELWAGPECTVNRVGDRFHEQLARSGFAHRLDDLDRLASLGITRMRFPILWERCAAGGPGTYDFAWCDERLARLRELGVAPIAGLLHHGSGPPWTDLLDPAFPEQLAAFAGEVARRYPHIDAYTPVNEPLTTARFSALYGVWYPHRSDDASFVRALLNQVRGTVLAMREVRAVNPQSALVQTEDLGLVTSMPRLAYQARFENLRRWLSFDLLFGRVGRRHRLWPYLRRHGASEAELAWFEENACPPDILGINTYVTSERTLDERVDDYPPPYRGGNGRDRYADMESVCVQGRVIGGFAGRLREASERYGTALAVTEAHLGSTREEQLRWLLRAWREAQALRDAGHDVRALTCWAAFGSFDWNSLVTRIVGHYEPGLWDVRSEPPRPTALATLARQLARGEAPASPVLEGPGWWERATRFRVPALGEVEARAPAGRPLLLAGGGGTLAQACARVCEMRWLPCHVLTREQMDIADPASVAAALERWQPWAVVNAAGFVQIDAAESDARQWRENADGPAVLAQACARRGVRLLHFSSDLVFGGGRDRPYVERDAPAPLNAYGRAKLAAEQRVLACCPDTLVVRTAAIFGPWDRHNFVTRALEALRRGERLPAADDQRVSPTYVPDLVQVALDLLIDGESGVWHLANRAAVSWADLARMAAEAAGLDPRLVEPRPGHSLGQRARRPDFSALGSERGVLMAGLEPAIGRYVAETAALVTTTHGNLDALPAE